MSTWDPDLQAAYYDRGSTGQLALDYDLTRHTARGRSASFHASRSPAATAIRTQAQSSPPQDRQRTCPVAEIEHGRDPRPDKELFPGLLMGEQPRAPLASSPSPIPNLGAEALAQGGGLPVTGNDQLIQVHHSDPPFFMSGNLLPPAEPLLAAQPTPLETPNSSPDTSLLRPPNLDQPISPSTRPGFPLALNQPQERHASDAQSALGSSPPLLTQLSPLPPKGNQAPSSPNLATARERFVNDSMSALKPCSSQTLTHSRELLLVDQPSLSLLDEDQLGSVTSEQSRTTSPIACTQIPIKEAAAFATVCRPQITGNSFLSSGSNANHLLRMSGLAPELQPDYLGRTSEASLLPLVTPPNKTLPVTSLSSAAAETSLAEPLVQLSSAPYLPVFTSDHLSTELSSPAPATADDLTCDLAAVSIEPKQEVDLDAYPNFTHSHLRHLNKPTFSFEGGPALLSDCYSLGTWAIPDLKPVSTMPLLLEVPSARVCSNLLWSDLLVAVHSGDHYEALDIHSSFLKSYRSQLDRTDVALLQRNTARLLLLLNQPEAALTICKLTYQTDSEDVRNELLLSKALAQAGEPPTEEEYSTDDTSEGNIEEDCDLDPIQDDTSEGDSEEDNDLDPVEEMNRVVARTRLKHGF